MNNIRPKIGKNRNSRTYSSKGSFGTSTFYTRPVYVSHRAEFLRSGSGGYFRNCMHRHALFSITVLCASTRQYFSSLHRGNERKKTNFYIFITFLNLLENVYLKIRPKCSFSRSIVH